MKRERSHNGEQDERGSDQQPRKRLLERGPHPYGVKPLGNLWEARDRLTATETRKRGLGSLGILTDEIILQILETYFSARDLCHLSRVSPVLYVFAHHEDLWRTLVINRAAKSQQSFRFRQTWKQTFLDCLAGNNTTTAHVPIRRIPYYSDTLFQSWYCSSMSIDPAWVEVDNIDRIDGAMMSVDDFIRNFEAPNKPVLITNVVERWPAYKKWNEKYLQAASNSATLEAGAVQFTFKDYFTYAHSTVEERPLYIFDKRFVDKIPQLGKDYTVPEYFSEDLFSLLGDRRPFFRWLIVGPARSGSTWHVDPNATSAWNAVIRGSKKWIMYPPSHPPPGVYPSLDGSEVTSPVALTEWFDCYYAETKHTAVQPVECVVKEGEMIYVPSGWWHVVINLEDSIAITQNFASSQNLTRVLTFLRDKRDQVSGCRSGVAGDTLYEDFCAVLGEQSGRSTRSIVETFEQGTNGKIINKVRDGGESDVHQFSFGF